MRRQQEETQKNESKWRGPETSVCVVMLREISVMSQTHTHSTHTHSTHEEHHKYAHTRTQNAFSSG